MVWVNDVQQRVEQIKGKLRDNGYKLTHQRMAVIRILARSKGHPSVEQIFERLRPDFPTMSLATVYRNVMLVKSLGEALELGFADGSNRYDGNKPFPHPHVVCVRCRAIVDPDLDSVADMTAEVAAETGFEMLTHRLDFFGLCSECRRNEP
jgi:Fur family peroxide stress response transcriptional regulator